MALAKAKAKGHKAMAKAKDKAKDKIQGQNPRTKAKGKAKNERPSAKPGTIPPLSFVQSRRLLRSRFLRSTLSPLWPSASSAFAFRALPAVLCGLCVLRVRLFVPYPQSSADLRVSATPR